MILTSLSGTWGAEDAAAEERTGGGKLETTVDVSFKHFYPEVEQREGVVI